MKKVLINTLDDLDMIDGFYRLDPHTIYIFDNPIVFSERPKKDKRPYYRKFERNRGRFGR